MEALDKIAGILGYAVVNAEDGTVEKTGGSSASPLGDLSAFFSSAAEVIKNALKLGEIDYLSLCYGGNRLIVFLYNNKYLGIEVSREVEPYDFVTKVKNAISPIAKVPVKEEPAVVAPPPEPVFEPPRSISSKLQQINLLVIEFGGEENKTHWIEILNQGLGALGGDLLQFVGIIEGKLTFKGLPPGDKEEEFVQVLRTLIDFLVKKAVEEFGSSQARLKVQNVIEKMKKGE